MQATTEQQREILQFIIDYILDNSPQEDIEVNEQTDFIAQQLLDSFAILSMIMTLESEFSVKLTPQELADPEMRRVGTLAGKIAEKLATNG